MTTDSGQHSQRVLGVGQVKSHGAANHVDLARDARIVMPGSPSNAVRRIESGKSAEKRRRSRRISNPHFSRAKNIGPGGVVHAELDFAFHLVPRHRWFTSEV